MTFPLLNCERRTNESFRNLSDRSHHRTASPLVELNIDMVKVFAQDYMHLTCQGTIKKWTLLLKETDDIDLHHRLFPDQLQAVEERLSLANRSIPSDFNRDLKSFSDCNRWKATQYRTWGLYVAPVVLKWILSDEKFYHYLYFFVPMRILLCAGSNRDLVTFAGECLTYYVSEFGRIYGMHHLHFNIHVLIHLVQDYLHFDFPLDVYSCFPPETYLGQMIRLIRGTKRPLAQIFKRHSEREAHPKVMRELNFERLAKLKKTGFDAIKPGSARDSVCLLHFENREIPYIIKVSEVTDYYVHGFKFKLARDFATGEPLEFFDIPHAPCPATDLGFYICDTLNFDREMIWDKELFTNNLVEKAWAMDFYDIDDIEGEIPRILIVPFINNHV